MTDLSMYEHCLSNLEMKAIHVFEGLNYDFIENDSVIRLRDEFSKEIILTSLGRINGFILMLIKTIEQLTLKNLVFPGYSILLHFVFL